MMMEQTLENTLLFEVFDWESQETESIKEVFKGRNLSRCAKL